MRNEHNRTCFVFFVLTIFGFFTLPFFAFSQELPMAIDIEILRKWQQNGSFKNNLVPHSKGKEVMLLQSVLSRAPFLYLKKKTGYYGTLTVGAVKSFQKEYQLTETGVFDTETRRKMNEILLSNLCPQQTPQQTTAHPEFLMKKIEKDSPLPSDYTPPNLKDISTKVRTAGIIICLRADVVPHITQMFSDAQNDGVIFMITSGYRKPEIQKYLYDSAMKKNKDTAINSIAKPGLSEHQLGSTVDITDASIGFSGVDNRFGTSKGGRWLQKNAYKYGFIMSYKKDQEKNSGFIYEPWHWRFLGIDVATKLHEQDISYSESSL